MCGELQCRPGPWGEYSACRGGMRHRERVVFGASTCSVTVPLVEKQECNGTEPVVPCTVSEWSDWTSCNGGKQVSVARRGVRVSTCSRAHHRRG